MPGPAPSQTQHSAHNGGQRGHVGQHGRRGGRGWGYGRGGRRNYPSRKDESQDSKSLRIRNDGGTEAPQSEVESHPKNQNKWDGGQSVEKSSGGKRELVNGRLPSRIQKDQSASSKDAGTSNNILDGQPLPYRAKGGSALSAPDKGDMASILMSSSIHQERAASQQYEFAMTVQPAKFDTKANLRARHAAKKVGKVPNILPNIPAQKDDKPLLTVERPVSRKKQRTGFLHLPPELRWQIYEYIFTGCRVEIIRAKNEQGRFRLYSRPRRPRDPKKQTTSTVGAFTLLPLPMGLIFSCRTVYSETILQLYWTTQFIFNSTKAMDRFLGSVSKDGLANIRDIELNQGMYNEPTLTDFRYYKLRSDLSWSLACEEMSLTMASLKVLHVDLTIRDWPIHLEIGESWAQPILFFGGGDGLDSANITLRMSMFGADVREKVARVLEKELMNPKTYQIREDERLARELAGQAKASKILRLVM